MAKHTDSSMDGDHLGKFSGARVVHSGTQSRNSGEALQFANETYDTDAYHDAGANTRLTAPATGKYNIVGWVETSGGNAGSYIAFIQLDGTTSIGSQRETNAVVTVNKQLTVTVLGYPMNAAQYVELKVALPAATTMAATCSFSIQRVE